MLNPGSFSRPRPLIAVFFTTCALWWWLYNSHQALPITAYPAAEELSSHHDDRIPSLNHLSEFSEDTTSSTSPTYSRFSELLFPEYGIDGTARPWVGANHRMLGSLFRCIEAGNCVENQEKVVLLGTSFFCDVLTGATGGESIWAASIITALSNMGYSYLFVQDLSGAVYYHHMFPSLIHTIILQDDLVQKCSADPDFCSQSPQNPHGIPLWKILAFHFWGGNIHPLGMAFTISPEPYDLLPHDGPTNTYIGYSIESSCTSIPFVPHSDRPNQAWVLAKLLTYMAPNLERPFWHPTPAWSGEMMDVAAEVTGVKFVFGARNDSREDDETTMPDMPKLDNYVNVGQLRREEFVKQLARSRVLVGVGNPLISPTPYEALCLGVPFINPLYNEPNKMPAQQPFLSVLGPPYVYHVPHGDRDAFVKAVQDALVNPIDRYILDRMKQFEIEKRLKAVLEWDREKEALAVTSLS